MLSFAAVSCRGVDGLMSKRREKKEAPSGKMRADDPVERRGEMTASQMRIEK